MRLNLYLGRKQPKTLSGIETWQRRSFQEFLIAENNLKPYQGLKHPQECDREYIKKCRKQPKTLSGIETSANLPGAYSMFRRKQPKTLSGIETELTTTFWANVMGPKTT